MSNYQCYCYGIIAINNLLENNVLITSDSFFHELYNLWDVYSEKAIEKVYSNMVENGKI